MGSHLISRAVSADCLTADRRGEARRMQALSKQLEAVLNDKQQQEVTQLFRSMDCDGSGELSRGEVDDFFSHQGQRPRALGLLDSNGDGNITWSEWNHFFLRLDALGKGKVNGILKILKDIADRKMQHQTEHHHSTAERGGPQPPKVSRRKSERRNSAHRNEVSSAGQQ